MKFDYYPDTDSLYIALSAKEAVDAREVAPNIVFDYDTMGMLSALMCINTRVRSSILTHSKFIQCPVMLLRPELTFSY